MIKKLLCWFGWHDWDGHTDTRCYPVPQCRHCKRWYRDRWWHP